MQNSVRGRRDFSLVEAVGSLSRRERMAKKFYRSRSNRQIAGVCGGLAEYFDLDPTLVRIAMVASALGGGFGLFFYIIALLFVPEAPAER